MYPKERVIMKNGNWRKRDDVRTNKLEDRSNESANARGKAR
jgi:hypothetical protein